MTYNDIIQKPGKRVLKHVCFVDGERQGCIGDSSIKSVKLSFKTTLTGTIMQGCELVLKEIVHGDIYVDIEAFYGEEYDIVTYGPFFLKEEPEYNASDKSYTYVLYDEMLSTMVDYEPVNVTYPTTIYNYFTNLLNKINLYTNLQSLPNGNILMPSDIYDGINYTYRDVLDDIAQANGVLFYVDNAEVKIASLGAEPITINDKILKKQNIDFSEHFGPINVIVASRAGDSDNIYYPTTLPENPHEFKISDNQLMAGNNRDLFLPAIYNQLAGVEYDIFDTELVGYGEILPLTKVVFETNNKTYESYVFNQEIVLANGYKQTIYAELPEETNTDYKYADTTDRRINQTYLVVDKQNQAIEGVVSQVSDQNEQIATIRLQYNELLSRISDIADITTSGESSYASVDLADVNASQPISIKIKPINENICYLYPYSGLYPSSTLYSKSRTLRFTNTTTSEVFDWVLPADLWYYDSNTYDELELSYGDGTNSSVIVTRRCKINADGTISALATPTTETYAYPSEIILTDGDYTINLIDNTTGYLYVQLMAKNIYTTQFYTKAETNSIINQTASSINLSVDTKLSNYSTTMEMNSAIALTAGEINQTVSQKVGNNEIISKINQTSEQITINANKLNLQGYITASDLSGSGTTTINGSNIKTGTIDASQVNVTNINASNITGGTISADKISGGTINGTNVNITNLSANSISGGVLNLATGNYGRVMFGAGTSHLVTTGINLGYGGVNAGISMNGSGIGSCELIQNFSGGSTGSIRIMPNSSSGYLYLTASSGNRIYLYSPTYGNYNVTMPDGQTYSFVRLGDILNALHNHGII